MTNHTTSVAMTEATEKDLLSNLVRADEQEDLCLATYQPSTGMGRVSALVTEAIPPEAGDRIVHGNATLTAEYVLRAAEIAQSKNSGLVLLHSHPGAIGWQPMSRPDHEAESSYAYLARTITGHPMVGMTLATRDNMWSARHWDTGSGRQMACTYSTNVRVIGDKLSISWNETLRPPPRSTERQVRTVSSWGERCQADIARRRVLVVGAGSVGLDVAVRLAASGICDLTVMDFDLVEFHNLDRLIGADAPRRNAQATQDPRSSTGSKQGGDRLQLPSPSIKPVHLRARGSQTGTGPRHHLLLRRQPMGTVRPERHSLLRPDPGHRWRPVNRHISGRQNAERHLAIPCDQARTTVHGLQRATRPSQSGS